MAVKINDLTLPKQKLETEYQVVQVTRWQKVFNAIEKRTSGWLKTAPVN